MIQPDYSTLTLRTAGGCELEILPAAGGITNGLRLCAAGRAFDLIAGLTKQQDIANNTYYRGVPLFPVVNRLDGGRYSHLGKNYQLALNEPERNNALHSFLYNVTPTAEIRQSETSSTCTLNYSYCGDNPGYPFPVDVQFQFSLADDTGLELIMSVTNRAAISIPFGIGWHPWFTLGGVVDDWQLQLPPVKSTIVDERMLPTGEQAEFGDFAELKRIGDTEFDTCFAIQDTTRQTRATTVLWSQELSVGLEVWQEAGDGSMNYLQLCTAPDRKSIAIEPVSCGINALNTGEGLLTLEPNHEFRSRAGVRLLTQTPTAA